jgi:hypothetical protein
MAEELGCLQLADIGLAPRAILLVPRMVISRPLRRSGAAGQFAGCVADTLKGALERARRPWESHSADDPLLFEDEADAAAALIGSWLRGSSERHWWSIVTAGLEPPEWWRRHIIREAFLLPRVLARLADRAIALDWIARLDPIEVESAIATLARGYGLPRPPSARTRRSVPDAAGGSMIERIVSMVPEVADPGLPPRIRLRVAMALLAHRRTAFLSTPAAHRALAVLAETDSAPTAARAVAPIVSAADLSGSPRTGAAGAALSRTNPRAARRYPAPRAAPSAAPVLSVALQPVEPAETPTLACAATPFVTEFAGLLFLLNAFIALEIYGDFTRPDRTICGLSPFALIARLGSHWFGRRFRDDPLHALLLDLAGDDLVLAAPQWAVQQSWLEPWPKPRSLWVGRERPRRYVWHPAGFPVAELRRASARSSRRLKAKDRLARLPRSPAHRWIACLGLYLRARLARTLGRPDAIDFLCHLLATVEFDDERVTARFALADHPLAIRLAGLDRNPGWVPAAGRIVEFAFE